MTPASVAEAQAAERAAAVRTALDHLRHGDADTRHARCLGTLLVSTWAQANMAGLYDGDDQ